MSAADVPLRVEFEKLLATVRALASNIGSLEARMELIELLSFVKMYPVYTAVQAITVNPRIGMLIVLSDYNGINSVFTRDVTYTPILQGADGLTDISGATFKRFQNE
jgi:hypothetical protein